MCAISLGLHSFHIVVNAVAQIDVKVPWFTKECFVAGGAAAMDVVATGVASGDACCWATAPPFI